MTVFPQFTLDGLGTPYDLVLEKLSYYTHIQFKNDDLLTKQLY